MERWRRRSGTSASPATSVLWGISYFSWRRLQATRRAPDRASPDAGVEGVQVTVSATKQGMRVGSCI